MVELVRTQAALSECEEHLKATNSNGTIIESYLTEHTLVIFCSDVQQCVYQILESRVKKFEDLSIRSFVLTAGRKNIRSANFNRLSEFTGFFGQDVKDRFVSALVEEDITIYGNAVRERNDVAHEEGGGITFNELKKAVSAGIRILQAFATAIGSE